MEIKLNGKTYLVPFNPEYYSWWEKQGKRAAFMELYTSRRSGKSSDVAIVCLDCGHIIWEERYPYYRTPFVCPNCGNSYAWGDSCTYTGHGKNVLISPSRIITQDGEKMVSFRLFELEKDNNPQGAKATPICRITYSRSKGVVWQSLIKGRVCNAQTVQVTQAVLDEPIVKKLLDNFEKVYPNSGVRNVIGAEKRVGYGFNLKTMLNYFAYLKTYPHLEQLAKSGYGHILSDILRFSPAVIKRKLNDLFKQGTREKDIVKLPSYVREFIKTDKNMDDKRVQALIDFFADEPNMSKEVFQMFRKAFPHYIQARIHINYIKNECGYTFAEVCKLILNNQSGDYPRRVIRFQRDYVRMCRAMGVPFVRFPKNVKQVHDEISSKYKVKKNECLISSFNQRVEEYKGMRQDEKGYLIRSPQSLEELIREGEIMHHCVASYAERFAGGTSLIFFMRRAEDLEQPYITMEFNRSGNLVQAHKAYNRNVDNREESALIQRFKTEVLIPELRRAA